MALHQFKTLRNQVPYYEDISYRETYREGSKEAVRICLVSADALDLFVADMMEDAVADVAASGLTIDFRAADGPTLETIQPNNTHPTYKLRRKLPEPHPRQAISHLVVSEVGVLKGEGYPGIISGAMAPMTRGPLLESAFPGGIIPKTALAPEIPGMVRLAVTYKSLRYNASITDAQIGTVPAVVTYGTLGSYDDTTVSPLETPGGPGVVGQCELVRYVTRRAKPAGQNIPLAGTQAVWAATGNGPNPGRLVGEKIPRTLPSTHLTYIWRAVPHVPWTAGAYIGKVNFFRFDRLGSIVGGIFRGELLYLYPEVSEPYVTVSGNTVFDITYHFERRQPGHNFIFRSEVFDFRRVIHRHRPNGTLLPNLALVTDDRPYFAGHNIRDYVDLSALFLVS